MKSLAYVWRAVDAGGQIRQGICEAAETSDIRIWLREQGLYPLTIKPRKKSLRSLLAVKNAKSQWAVFTRRLSVALEAGIPLLKALDIISVHVSGKNNEIQWQGVKEQIQRGSSIAEALQIVTPAPSLFIKSMVKAGEKTGTLAKTLSEVAEDLEQECLFQRKIQSALAYPSFLAGAVICVIFVLSLWVLPTYEKLFSGLGTQLPYLTMVIFACGRQIPLIFTVLFIIGFSTTVLVKLAQPQSWQEIISKLITHIPLFGQIMRFSELVQFCRIFRRLLGAGIPLLEALHFTESTVQSKPMQKLVRKLATGVRQGKSLTEILRGSTLFPPDACEMLHIAEEAGKLDDMLQHLVVMFHQELDQKLIRLVHLLEPLLILGLAGLIGLVAIGILLPVFDLTTSLQ
ncbi:MAG TPA: type II secretion system F family protein [Desulfitobacteriaceae bacterium]|nr:type II secretion system F family protein [Desulfitobacteriaceae bacterium]